MDLLKTILGQDSGALVEKIAKSLDLEPSQAAKVIDQLAPALGRGIAKNTTQPEGLDALLGALKSGNHERYLENPDLAVDASGVDEGNKILGHILGNKDVSRQLASRASEQTGVSDSLIKKMLPMLATIAMGALSKKSQQAPESGSALGGVLGSFLGGESGNPMIDDLIGMAGKFFNR